MPDDPGGALVLDTHVWLWVIKGDRTRLAASAISAVEAARRRGQILISAISVWEIAMLEAKGRISLIRLLEDWVRAALRAPGSRLLELTPEIAIESTRLPGAPHGDPADRILIARARRVSGRLATCDSNILSYAQAGHLAVLDACP